MGIWEKLSTLIRSNINDAIAKAENPEKMLNQILLDMRDQLQKAKTEVAVAIADERKLKAQMEDEQKLSNDWEHRAMLAVRENRDDLAKQALMRQQEHAERALHFAETWQKQAGETERLKESLRQLNDKIEEAKRKKNLLIAKQKRAQAHQRIHETMAGLNDKSAFEAFDRIAEKVEESERMVAASVEVHEALSSGDQLEKQFKQLSAAASDQGIEWKLLQLKEKMQLGSGGAAAKPQQALKPGSSSQGTHIVKDAELEEEA
ncbi:MAG TPA: PspA/IM30 family protein [Longimicrobiales bacterium]